MAAANNLTRARLCTDLLSRVAELEPDQYLDLLKLIDSLRSKKVRIVYETEEE